MNPTTTESGMQFPVPVPHLAHGAAFTPGAGPQAPAGTVHNLSSNESAVGAAPSVRQLLREQAGLQHLYPEPDGDSLVRALAARHGLDPRGIVTGPGSESLINWIVQGWADRGDEVLYSAHGFQAYRIRATTCGARPVAAPETALRTDVDQLLAAVTPRTRILFLSNPNNPTGTWLPRAELLRLREGLRPDVLLVLDEAYVEYVEAPGFVSGLDLVRDDTPNVAVLRTFSKFYGLAGLRVGWACVPTAMTGPLALLRGPFAVTRPGLAAAVAALADEGHQALALAHNRRWRPWLQDAVRALGYETTDSIGNFVLLRVPGGAAAARALHAALARRGFITRLADQNGLPDWIRVTVGLQPAMEGFVAALRAETGPGPR